MIRAVLDANVVVSAILSPKGIPAKILTAWRAEEFSVVVSEAIVIEIAECSVIQRSKDATAGLRKAPDFSGA